MCISGGVCVYRRTQLGASAQKGVANMSMLTIIYVVSFLVGEEVKERKFEHLREALDFEWEMKKAGTHPCLHQDILKAG